MMDESDWELRESADGEDSFEALLRSVARTPSVLRPGTRLAEGRFEVQRLLGQGGMGSVYEAVDHVLGQPVALKTLNARDPQRAYRLKREFRRLSSVVHPNLVGLHDFFATEALWFFTMERVQGQDFLSYVRPDPSVTGTKGCDADRLRASLAQLAEGVSALHGAGKLHCDLKPGNVMVSDAGQLVILDFGLVFDWAPDALDHTLAPCLGGTPGYMPPEQEQGGPLSPASDYYAVGVMVMEALYGRGAGVGDGRRGAAASNAALWDLRELAQEFTRSDPAERPSATEFIARCGAQSRPASLPTQVGGKAMLGREREFATLLAAVEASAAETQAVLVCGASGVGKTHLCRALAEVVQARPGSSVLLGACRKREHVPFNAFDGVIDALGRRLRSWGPDQAAVVWPTPAQAAALCAQFPALGRVPALSAGASRGSEPGADPLAVQAHAITGLRQLLAQLTRSGQVLLAIDDWQFADADSHRLLERLLESPTPALTIVVFVRSAEGEAPDVGLPGGLETQTVNLRALSPAASSGILRQRGVPESRRSAMIDAARGNPRLLEELSALSEDQLGDDVTLAALLSRRVFMLDAPARSLLSVLALAGGALPRSTCLRFAEQGAEGLRRLTELRNQHFLHLAAAAVAEPVVELVHRELIVAVLAQTSEDEQQSLHRKLADHYAGCGDHESAARHLLLLGERDASAAQYLLSAAQGERALAFASAARDYRMALRLARFTPLQRRDVSLRLATALRRAGRPAPAGGVLLQVAANTDDADQLRELRRQSAQLLLSGGQLEEGRRVLRSVLSAAGLQYPENPRDIEVQVAKADAQLRDQGVFDRTHELASRPGGDVQQARSRADACFAAATLGPYDPQRAYLLAALGLHHALHADSAEHLQQALSTFAVAVAASGHPSLASALIERAKKAPLRLSQNLLSAARKEVAEGQVLFFAGEFSRALSLLDRAEQVLRPAHADAMNEVQTCVRFAHMCLQRLGRWDELSSRGRAALSEARSLGHRHAEASARVLGVALGHLLEDQPQLALAEVERCAALWPRDHFHGESLRMLRMQVLCDVYTGCGAQGLLRLQRAARSAQLSRLLDAPYWSRWWSELEATAALAACAEASEAATKQRFLEPARRAVHALSQQPGPAFLYLPFVAGLARIEGRDDQAAEALTRLLAAPSKLLAVCAMRELAKLKGYPAGARKELPFPVAAPTRLRRILLPGFDG